MTAGFFIIAIFAGIVFIVHLLREKPEEERQTAHSNILAEKILHIVEEGTWTLSSDLESVVCQEKNIIINMDFPFVTCNHVGVHQELGAYNTQRIRRKARKIYDAMMLQRRLESERLQAERVREAIRDL